MKPAWFNPDLLNTPRYEKHSRVDLRGKGYQRWVDDTVCISRIWVRKVTLVKGRIVGRDLKSARERLRDFQQRHGKR